MYFFFLICTPNISSQSNFPERHKNLFLDNSSQKNPTKNISEEDEKALEGIRGNLLTPYVSARMRSELMV